MIQLITTQVNPEALLDFTLLYARRKMRCVRICSLEDQRDRLVVHSQNSCTSGGPLVAVHYCCTLHAFPFAAFSNARVSFCPRARTPSSGVPVIPRVFFVFFFPVFVGAQDTRTIPTMLKGESKLRASLVRFLMECDEALEMRNDGYINPLFAHSPVRVPA